MVSSARQAIARFLLILVTIISARSQTVADKGLNGASAAR